MKHVVALTGAGISAESGLKTFRGNDGLWMGHDIYAVASPMGWRKDPELVLSFYNARRKDVLNAQPNAAHNGLAELENKYRVTIVTQNIDDLHERAGSSRIMHLHGEIFKMRSENDPDSLFHIRGDMILGDKAADGSQLRPAVVWFDEAVPLIIEARKIISSADIFILIGTSLQVYPAAGLIDYVPPGAPRYIIDTKIPNVRIDQSTTIIDKPATEGVELIKKLLLSMKTL